MGQDVSVSPRRVVSQTVLSSVSTSVATSISAPSHALGAMIQADGGTIRVGLGVTPTSTLGIRLDDGQVMNIDTALAGVSIIAVSAVANAQVVFFDKP